MAQPYVGEIRMFAGTFAPNGWLFCEGQLLPISENEVLFQLIGTTYGGDGESTFALPNLSGRVPIHMGTGPDGTTYQIGEMAGVEQVTLTMQQIPQHSHALSGPLLPGYGANSGNSASPVGTFPAIFPGLKQYGKTANLDPATQMQPPTGYNSNIVLAPSGGSQPHYNMQPFLAVNFIISLFGIFPSQT